MSNFYLNIFFFKIFNFVKKSKKINERGEIMEKGEMKQNSNRPSIVTEDSQLYIVGGGMAGLSAAIFAIRDAHILGKNVHILETRNSVGGSLYGEGSPATSYFTLGDWKFHRKAYNCTWDVLSAIPSLDAPNKSVKEEIFDYNKTHVKDVQVRLIHANQSGDRVEAMGVTRKDIMKIIKLIFISEKKIENRRIDSWFTSEFFTSNFWKVFSSMFAIEHWNDLVEMKRYARRFLSAIHKMVSGKAEVVTPYNNYNSMTEPMRKWLEEKGVNFEMKHRVIDMDFNPSQDKLTVERLHYTTNDENDLTIDVKDHDFVFATTGSMIADYTRGSKEKPAYLERERLDGSWTLWENIVKKRPNSGLGNPQTFDDHVDESAWMSFIVNSDDSTFIDLYEKFTGNKPGQANMVTLTDSNWHSSILVPSQPHFRDQPKNKYLWAACGFKPFVKGNFVDKTMAACNGQEIMTEICHHLGFVKELPHILETSTCVPGMLPYVMSHFLPRKRSDRPKVVPDGSTNLAFMGQFTESEECVMLVESSIRCAKIAVNTLFQVDKKVPPVYTGLHNPVKLLRALRTVSK